MGALIFGGSDAALRMTSQEIADLVEKRHDNVKRTIESLADQGVIVRPQIEDEPGNDAMGRPRITQVYVFTGERGKRDSIVVVAQLSPQFTARLVDRWQELESGAAALPKTLPEALRLAADLADQKAKAEEALAIAAPKVETYERISDAEGSMCIRDAASSLQMQPSKLTAWLSANGWIYHRAGKSGWLAYHDKQQAGYLVHKSTPYTDRVTGDERVSEQVRITMRGLTRLGELVPRDQGRMRRASGYTNREHRGSAHH
ncbi:phage antirepressor KilAC domain-containing protein [Burkholderia sp. BCCIQ04A]|uniref:Phage antirepressor KilAC domain-containing protein n=1 Tax=Burkholderia anthinoferrum TaxID=3090833 RepID=A0ABU5WTM8_9BURK|nr:phage antirepressor KilAC domain-containing protein [Burkholderia anthinoferrum]MEB2535924.1 phage antirepressor KilAC domain-containing protein [Burkholderia anthinoferrum]MEB2562052.1 phage antirepressor KilAC domain-containing protein [Burkholderia anthinoferrum]MEB2582352.1 phage antirepressor KilAC domain-containing protein [Burkholderia anthinoferrum]MEB2632678.1 phage antirepressor KilAC domain-containing protein [Burkholderia anthinoferrum]